MNTLSLIAVIWVCRCVVNGQLPVNKPFYFAHHSTFINQPTRQQNDGRDVQLLSRELFGKNYFFQGAILLEIKRLQATTRSLEMQLKGKADQTELDITNANILKKADQTELDKTNDDVWDLKTLTSPSSIGSIPTSCEDLETIGFVKSGIYSVIVNKQVQDVYCDFTKSTTSADFQKYIGYVNVKSFPVYFYAQRDGNYDVVNTGIPFNKIKMNEGTALDTSTGEFLAPLTGKYFFSYMGLCWNNEAKIQLEMETSGTTTWLKIGDAHCSIYNTLSIQSTLQLAKGDRVRIYLTLGTTHDDGNNFTNYVGWLLEEDISP